MSPRTSRKLAQRLALYEAVLKCTTSELDRARILRAIRRARGDVKNHADRYRSVSASTSAEKGDAA